MDQIKSGSGTGAQGPGQVDKPLGRGLEDVSHLFLSQRRKEEAAAHEPMPGHSPERAHPQAGGSPPATVLLQPRTWVTHDQLSVMLRDAIDGLEEGLRGIDANIPCPPYSEISLLAVTRASQLTIIDFDTTSNDGLLLRGMGHFDWIVRNVLNVRRMYPGQPINFSLAPRIILVAPQFSLMLRRVVRHFTRPQIDWVRYHVVDVSGGLGIFFERVVGE